MTQRNVTTPRFAGETAKQLKTLLRNTSVAWASLLCTLVIAFWPAEPAHGDDSADSLLHEALAPPNDLPQLSFRPSECRYLDRIKKSLDLSPPVQQMFDRCGVIVVRQHAENNFGEAFFGIYQSDLPVLITSDSILHVFHRSFDNTVKQMEERVLSPALAGILEASHDELERRAKPGLADEANYRDVDLYLTVARKLLARGGSPLIRDSAEPVRSLDGDRIHSSLGQDADVRRIIAEIDSLHMQDPSRGEGTRLYGGRRPTDYSQFRPRGHYDKSPTLRAYFQAMMWLGRADCGLYPLGAPRDSGITSDAARELRNAVLLTELLAAAKQLPPLDVLDRTVAAFGGESDNLRPMQFKNIMDACKLTGITDLHDAAREADLREAILRHPSADQKIQSQVYFGANQKGDSPVAPPALYQLFGQRFLVDSYALAHVVYDTVQTRDGSGEHRKMPRGVDAMASLGSPEALHELAGDLRAWQYAPQLSAVREFAKNYLASPEGQRSIADQWLSTLRTLHADMTGVKNFPQAMQTRAWRLKQLNAQLASWAEMRHDGILVVKQSYTRRECCEYPAGFVEPYPEFYRGMAAMARRLAGNLADFQVRVQASPGASDVASLATARKHWSGFAATMSRLQGLAEKELKGEMFSTEDQRFLKDTVVIHEREADTSCKTAPDDDGNDDPPDSETTDTVPTVRSYSGWYCDLLYPSASGIDQFMPTVADVHTDSNAGTVLEAGAGRADLVVVAVDNGIDRMAFVGPISTYYEFRQPVDRRMTDEEFKDRLTTSSEADPERPEWFKGIYAPAK